MLYVHFVPTSHARRQGFLSEGSLPVATSDAREAREMGTAWLDNFMDDDGTVMSDRWETCCVLSEQGHGSH